MVRNSLLKMTSSSAGVVFDPVLLRAEEGISEAFCFTIDMLANSASVAPDTVLGMPACVTLTHPYGGERHFHGIARSFHGLGPDKSGKWRYRAELVPKFWFASQTIDSRIFTEKTTTDILKKIFTENGFDATFTIVASQASRAYTVQYNETDYDFAIRLMEEEGCFWYFEHSEGGHRMVVTDSNTAFTTVEKPIVQVVEAGNATDILSRFTRITATAVGKVTLRDYDPLHPATPVVGEQTTILSAPGNAGRDVHRFPALTATASIAGQRARLRQEAAEAAANLFEGASTNPGFVPGKKFTVQKDAWHTDTDTIYVVRRVVHDVSDDFDGAGAAVDRYHHRFEAFPAATAWRDWPQERRPQMAGIHSAVVVGPAGEEIFTDKYGRIKVRFFWDHRRDATADGTIFVRVMQPWSGKTWGWQHLPRVGAEVAVAFVNGDPDHPVVVGSLYNAEQMPPFELPAQKTKTGLRTRSSPKGGTAEFTEWSIDDKKGEELVFFHAQKDFTEEVENDHNTLVMHDQKLKIDHDQTTHVVHDQTLKVDNVRIHKVGKTEDITIGDAQTNKIGNGRTTAISKGDEKLTVDMGNISVAASMGKIEMTAMQSIELKVGSSSVKIDQTGVTIKGLMVSIEGTLQLDLKGVMTNVKGSAMLMVKGGLVMIN